MKKAQIDHILDSLNTTYGEVGTTLYGSDIWLEAEEIAVVILGTDENVYPDSTCQIYFDSTNELLKTRTGKYRNGVFVPKHNPYIVTTYDSIVGIILADELHTKSSYKRGAMV